MLIFVGMPAFFLELSLGQYARVGANKVFGRMVPAFNGLGYSMIALGFLAHNNGVLIIAWSLYYLVIGFQKDLPWGSCDQDWNTVECYSLKFESYCHNYVNDNQTTWYNKTCVSYEEYCQSHGNRTHQVIEQVHNAQRQL